MNRDCAAIRNKLLQALDPTFSFQNQILALRHPAQHPPSIKPTLSRHSLSRQPYLDEPQDLSQEQEAVTNETDDSKVQIYVLGLHSEESRQCGTKKHKCLNLKSNSNTKNVCRPPSAQSLNFSERKPRKRIFGNTPQNKNTTTKAQLKRSCSVEVISNNPQPSSASNYFKTNMHQSIVTQRYPMNDVLSSKLNLQSHISIANRVSAIRSNGSNHAAIVQNISNSNIVHMPIKRIHPNTNTTNNNGKQQVASKTGSQRYAHLKRESRVCSTSKIINFNYCNQIPVQLIPHHLHNHNQIPVQLIPHHPRKYNNHSNTNNKQNVMVMGASIQANNSNIALQAFRGHQFAQSTNRPYQNSMQPVFRTISKRQLSTAKQVDTVQNQVYQTGQPLLNESGEQPTTIILSMLQHIIDIQNNQKPQNKDNSLEQRMEEKVAVPLQTDKLVLSDELADSASNVQNELDLLNMKANQLFLKYESKLSNNIALPNQQSQDTKAG